MNTRWEIIPLPDPHGSLIFLWHNKLEPRVTHVHTVRELDQAGRWCKHLKVKHRLAQPDSVWEYAAEFFTDNAQAADCYEKISDAIFAGGEEA